MPTSTKKTTRKRTSTAASKAKKAVATREDDRIVVVETPSDCPAKRKFTLSTCGEIKAIRKFYPNAQMRVHGIADLSPAGIIEAVNKCMNLKDRPARKAA